MAGRTYQMGYLFHIELMKKGCLDKPSAITGQELFRRLNTIPLSYRRKWAPWFGYDFMMIADWARNVHNKTSLDFLVETAAKQPDYIELACDSEMDYEQKRKGHFTAKYWLYNVNGNGQSFYCGISERNIEVQLALIGDYPLQGLTELSQIQNDFDCFDYIKTWLDTNWRRPDQITTKSAQQIREELYKELRIGKS